MNQATHKRYEMNKILIVAATYFEVRQFIEANQLETINKHLHQKINKHATTDVLITGIGGVATACRLAFQLRETEYDFAVNVGIAGSFNADINIGSVVNVVSDCQGDLGIEDQNAFVDLFEANLENKNLFPYKNGLLHNISVLPDKFIHLDDIQKVKGITVNTAHGNKKSIEKFRDKYRDIDVETMEGAAFFYTCLLANIPFVALRSISNTVAERNKDNWNIPLALSKLNKVISNL